MEAKPYIYQTSQPTSIQGILPLPLVSLQEGWMTDAQSYMLAFIRVWET